MFKFISIVLDPWHKIEFVEFEILDMFDSEKDDIIAAKLEEVTRALYNEYKAMH